MNLSRKAAVVWYMLAGAISFAGQVDRTTAARAEKIVFALDYLPFKHLENGCNSRAIYMGMELADAGIPSVQQYAAGTVTFTLFPRPDQAWDWHTAPLIWILGDTEPTVLDPSLATGALSRSAWVKKLHAISPVRLFWSDIGTLGIGDRTAETAGPASPGRLPKKVSELSGFRGGDLTFASREMCAYLDDDAEKKKKLEQRTHELLESLEKKELVTDYAVSGMKDFRCE